MEMQRRLMVAIREFNLQSTRQSGRMIRLTWAIIGLTVALAVVAGFQLWATVKSGPSASADQSALAELQQTLARAWVVRDRATLERIIAPEWRSTGPTGRVTDRAEVFGDVFDKKVHRIQRIQIDDVTARVFGDAAVVTGLTHGIGDVAGSSCDVVIRFPDTLVRPDGQWQVVASHASILEGRE